MNISELLCWGESILGKKYSFDSKVLLAHCLNLKFNDIYFSHLNKKNITIKESELYKKLVLKSVAKDYLPDSIVHRRKLPMVIPLSNFHKNFVDKHHFCVIKHIPHIAKREVWLYSRRGICQNRARASGRD